MLALALLALTAPVPGDVARAFTYAGDPFAAGHHRGVDLEAAPGTPVRAACGGRVTFAGRAGANGRAVAIRCGRWSVTHLPLGAPAVRAGDDVAAGTRLGTAARAPQHHGLHLGVRVADDPLGYVDPAPMLHREPPPAPPAAPRARPRRSSPPPPRPEPLPSTPALRRAPLPARAAAGSSPLAPWLAWAGLALLLAGAAGTGTARARGARRARRASRARAAPTTGTVGP